MHVPIRIEVVPSDAKFLELKEAWNKLVKQTKHPHIFLTWEWLYTWWKHFGKQKESKILLARNQNGDLVGIAPFFKARERLGLQKLSQVKFLGTAPISSEYLDLIVSASLSQQVTHAFLAHLEDDKDLDLYCFTDSLPDSSLLSNYGRLLGNFKPVPAEVCPLINFPSSWEDYRQSISVRTRKYIQHIFKFFLQERGGTLKKASLRDFKPVLNRLFELHTRRWQSRGKEGSFVLEEKKRFHLEVSKRLCENGQLGLYYLELEGNIISILYGFYYQDTYYFYQSGFDLSYQKQSPGQVVLYHAIQDGFNSGIKRFDFLRGDEEYKLKWANGKNQTFNLMVPRTSKARLALSLAEKKAGLKKSLKNLLKKDSWFRI